MTAKREDEDGDDAGLRVCTPVAPPDDAAERVIEAAWQANPANKPSPFSLIGVAPLKPQFIAAMTTKWWGARGVRLSVGFLDGGSASLRKRLLLHFNAWGKLANVKFFEVAAGAAQVRVVRTPGQGYWSYLGTDVLAISRGEPTMCLDSFTMSTPEAEYRRVVRHEVGHTLGFPHEHMRREVVKRIDPEKAYKYFARVSGWSRAMVKSQVLTPIEESSLVAATRADPDSIMCYQLPGSIMRDGQAVPGGADIDSSDHDFIASLYPRLS